jgi:hypothetical protein
MFTLPPGARVVVFAAGNHDVSSSIFSNGEFLARAASGEFLGKPGGGRPDASAAAAPDFRGNATQALWPGCGASREFYAVTCTVSLDKRRFSNVNQNPWPGCGASRE